MRRLLSISLILLFWLGPLAAMLPASGDTIVPLCCRRHGAHHCMETGEQAKGGTPELRAPSRCPAFPNGVPATTGAQFALAASQIATPVPAMKTMQRVGGRDSLQNCASRAHTDRGPPSCEAV